MPTPAPAPAPAHPPSTLAHLVCRNASLHAREDVEGSSPLQIDDLQLMRRNVTSASSSAAAAPADSDRLYAAAATDLRRAHAKQVRIISPDAEERLLARHRRTSDLADAPTRIRGHSAPPRVAAHTPSAARCDESSASAAGLDARAIAESREDELRRMEARGLVGIGHAAPAGLGRRHGSLAISDEAEGRHNAVAWSRLSGGGGGGGSTVAPMREAVMPADDDAPSVRYRIPFPACRTHRPHRARAFGMQRPPAQTPP